MEVGVRQQERGVYHLAALALLLMGLGLVYLTWHNVNQQRQLVEQHAMLSARVILRGLEANLMRGMRRLGLGRAAQPQEALAGRVEDFFREMVDSKEVRYLGFFSPQGKVMLASADEDAKGDLILAPGVWKDIQQRGEWFGEVTGYGKPMLVFAAPARPGLASLCGMPDCDEPAAPPPGQGPGPGPGGGRGAGRGMGAEPGGAPPVMVIGLDAAEYYAPYEDFRRAAVLQTGYVLGMALTLWFLLLAYLRRRGLGKRLLRLEIFRSKLLDALPDGLLTLGRDGVVKSANPAAKDILLRIAPDYPGELVGAGFQSLPFAVCLEDCLAGGCGWRQFEQGGTALELLALPLDSANLDEPGDTLILARDRTQIKSLEENLSEARELAAVGRLAAGVAHEIRNPLSSLRGFAQFFLGKLSGREPEETYARTMVQEADRLNRVVTDLLFLAKPRGINPRPTDLTEVTESLRELLGIELELKRAAFASELGAPGLWADPDALKQALLNLALNSLAALPPEGGEIRLCSRAKDNGVEISLTDNGRGMNQDEAEKAFEPFFTSKEQGSGLGLAIVRKIMREHKGEAYLSATSSSGTTVSLYFPDGPES